LDVLIAGGGAYVLCQIPEREGKETRPDWASVEILALRAGAAEDGDFMFV